MYDTNSYCGGRNMPGRRAAMQLVPSVQRQHNTRRGELALYDGCIPVHIDFLRSSWLERRLVPIPSERLSCQLCHRV